MAGHATYRSRMPTTSSSSRWPGSSGTSSNVSTGAGDWLEANPAKRESSLAREEIALIRHILPALGDRKVATIKPTDVQGVVDGWKAAMAPSTVARTYSVLRAVLNLAIDRELLLRSPARGTRLPCVAAPQRRLPSLADLVTLAEAHPDDYEPMWPGAVLGLPVVRGRRVTGRTGRRPAPHPDSRREPVAGTHGPLDRDGAEVGGGAAHAHRAGRAGDHAR